jgi:hypothetical protein
MSDNGSAAAGADPAGPAEAAAAAEAEGGCAWCAGARVVLFAAAFAMFAAYVAADFATGGRLTAYVAGALAGLRGGGKDGTP